MKNIDIYSTPQCGFCKQLKKRLEDEHKEHIDHDVTTDSEALKEMQELTNGAMSVPVTVLAKGTDDQEVLIGYPDAVVAIFDDVEKDLEDKNEKGILTCPKCGHQQEGEVPTTACVPFYICEGCDETIKAEGEDCCVFCSYGDKPCPLKDKEHGCDGGVCEL